MLLLNAGDLSFAEQIENMACFRPFYLKTCACGHESFCFTEQANDPDYVAKRQNRYKCSECRSADR